MIGSFDGGTAVITGAASGLGLELARGAAGRGMRLALADVEGAALERVAAELREGDADVLAQVVDVADGAAVEAFGTEVEERFGTPNLVCNNAGVSLGGLVWEHSVADWEWVLGVNLWGVIHGVRVFVPMMLAAAEADHRYRGHVVNTASMAGLLTAPNMGVYNVSKHGVVALSETLYQDLQLVGDQVGASVLCPYFVPTAIARSERNRPGTVETGPPTRSQLVAQVSSVRAVERGKVSAEEVAWRVFDAVAHDRFYIFSHPHELGMVAERMNAVLSAANPPDPYAARPDLGEALRQQLRPT